jgi:hypothetical protein
MKSPIPELTRDIRWSQRTVTIGNNTLSAFLYPEHGTYSSKDFLNGLFLGPLMIRVCLHAHFTAMH